MGDWLTARVQAGKLQRTDLYIATKCNPNGTGAFPLDGVGETRPDGWCHGYEEAMLERSCRASIERLQCECVRASCCQSRRRRLTDAPAHVPAHTHMVTAMGDDQNPVIRLWDLRSSVTVPLGTLSGHTAGVLSPGKWFVGVDSPTDFSLRATLVAALELRSGEILAPRTLWGAAASQLRMDEGESEGKAFSDFFFYGNFSAISHPLARVPATL